MIRQAKRNYYHSDFHSAMNDMKRYWAGIGDVMGHKGKQCKSANKIIKNGMEITGSI